MIKLSMEKANVTVYISKKRIFVVLKRKVRRIFCRLVVTEFVKTCDELVIGL